MSNVFITGGAGFIGSHIVKRLSPDHSVTVFDHFGKNTLQTLGYDKHPNVTLVKGDILDAPLVEESMKGADIVIHAAAVIGVSEVNDQLHTIETNIIGTNNVLAAAVKNNVSERVVVFSTSEIFGGMAYKVSEIDSVISGPPGEPRWSYGISKIAGEHLANGYFNRHNLPTVCVRPFNVYGPGQTMKGAMQQFVSHALQNKDITINGDGSPIRSWCYVDDFVDAIIECINNPAAINESFNLGNSKTGITILELANKIIQLLGSSSKIIHGEELKMEIHLRIPDASKAKKMLGWEASTSLDEGIIKTAESVKKELDTKTIATS